MGAGWGASMSGQCRVRWSASSRAGGLRGLFTLVFEEREVGVRTATISIVSNDPDEGTYTFAVRGEALARPEFEIRCEGTVIPSGSGSELSCTDFGSVDVNSESVSKSFEIVNSGEVDLEVTQVGTAAPFFEDEGPSTLLPGETRVITVRFDPNSLGAISKTLEVSAVGVENSYFIELRGVGTGIAIPDASLRGQVAISSGDVTPTVAKNTDFGAHLVGSGDELRGLVLFNVGTGKSQSFNDVVNAVIVWHGKGEVRYIAFPEGLKEAYQSYTQADLAKLREVGCDVDFRDVASGVKTYLDALTG